MSKKTMKIFAIVIACLLVLGVLAPALSVFVFAVESNEVLRDYEKKENAALKELKSYEEQISDLGEKIHQNNERLKEIDKELSELNIQLLDAEEKEKAQMEKFRSRIVATCESSGVSYLELIFSSESISDFMDKIVIARELAEYDKNIIDSMHAVKEEIQGKKNKQEELKKEQEDAKRENDSAAAVLEGKVKDVEKYLSELKKDKEAYKKYLDEIERQEELAKREAGIGVSNGNAGTGKVSSGSLKWPTTSHYITDNFSLSRKNPVTGEVRPHKGVDIGGSQGDPIYAADSGTVVFANVNGGYGKCVIINHGNGVNTIYAHMSAILVGNGAKVNKGDQIGRVGSTGVSTGPHLHFEVLINGVAVNPMQFF